jgi:hypothetical protein
MGFLLFSAIFAISFAWMWNRNDKAKKKLKRVKIMESMDEDAFAAWRDHTRKRMSRADVAALLLTAMPLAALVPFGIHFCAWPALILAFKSNESGRKADALAKQLGFVRGIDWLASKKIPAVHEPARPEDSNSFTDLTLTHTETLTNMRANEFEVVIPEGRNLGDGYVGMLHNTQYSLLLKNHRRVRCDANVVIDGIQVGTWRIDGNSEIRIERPVHDTGHFTFFEMGSREAHSAGIVANPENGLISVAFKPEREMLTLGSSPAPDDMRAGVTGLTGESLQRFTDASSISHDTTRFFTIHIRLVCKMPEIRPLAPRSTPIPPPVG